MPNHICKFCGEEYFKRNKISNYCSNVKCKNEYDKLKYHQRLHLKKCKVCNKEFEGVSKKIICSPVCKLKYCEKNILIVQEIHCKYCGCFISHNNKYVSVYGKKLATLVIYKSCNRCKKKNLSDSKLGERNPNYKGVAKDRRKFKSKEEYKKYMSLHNPMKRKDVVDKVSNTIKKKYENGEIIRPIGKLSPLYKGNRRRSFSLRDRTKHWIKNNLKRSNYKCELCGIGGSLEVHHVKPFKDIICDFMGGKCLDELSTDEFSKLSEEIYNIHCGNEIKGIVVCPTCHSNIDEKRFI